MDDVKFFFESLKPPNRLNLDESLKQEMHFMEIIKDLNKEDNENVQTYLRGLYSQYSEKYLNKYKDNTDKAGKKSRRQKNKKRNTLKRGGSWVDVYDAAQYVFMLGVIGAAVLSCILNLERQAERQRNDNHWQYQDDTNYPM